jgi:hypothetical protein
MRLIQTGYVRTSTGDVRTSKELGDLPFVYLVEHCSISEPKFAVPRKKGGRRWEDQPSLGEPTWQTHRGSRRSPAQKISDFEVATMLTSEQELVMGKPWKKSQSQEQQEQEQAQLAVQSLDSKSDDKNSNDNYNDNKNSNDNMNSNYLDNKVDNKTNNSTDNKVDNNIDNKVENTVDTKVNVDVNLDLHATGLSSPVIDLHGITATDSLVMSAVVNQTLNGGGNQFDINQVNYLINDAKVEDPTVSFSGGGSWDHPSSGFSMDAKVTGGDSKIGDAKLGDVAGAGAGVVSHADASLQQDAFTQTITTGANIQFNSMTMQVAGHDLTDDHHVL